LELVRRLSLLHRGYAPIVNTFDSRLLPDAFLRYPDARLFFLGVPNAARNRLCDLPKGSKPFLRLLFPI
jgi:hypothetical protein